MSMRNLIGRHEVATDDELIELALGTPLDLWLGPEDGESPEERAARLDAARDILADDPALFDRTTRMVAELIETRAPDVVNVVALPRPATLRRPARTEAA
ncbi:MULTISPECIES: hypothetical protein [Streptomycetaceae]|uniref:Uncharacterized protein n=1 Tax=Streptantibioticus cattleyicolor (strain ATCC 35852 / DSM 46488 / JCM 4925 / NBRC 14057 / NRRL 8057) TaxID=1003195 RepID=F8JYA4_STREN|nr:MULTISPECIES: hypothetical protein [Streptomycetaceae]AEW95898.1 hypothetical protein SCATT_35270 [Streptantibioticus cattleyicolor NRRL 8057 = DSM 46488]MYS60436.1 hypothetical protein [Streptomyces sp. SID5468]CCB76234.1 protein of unknown function [Streptantibioticus cattleyicolor NRRL 8057 = DSM 46488]